MQRCVSFLLTRFVYDCSLEQCCCCYLFLEILLDPCLCAGIESDRKRQRGINLFAWYVQHYFFLFASSAFFNWSDEKLPAHGNEKIVVQISPLAQTIEKEKEKENLIQVFLRQITIEHRNLFQMIFYFLLIDWDEHSLSRWSIGDSSSFFSSSN